ncbi:hypothetical protein IHE44_0007364 [Lamprotornis superbus]|uniref:Uncharacterized protein n=1 Tax=Lamprotornis superbus TaxID=245042 RepID=A0A835NXD8_9PASS|nr:hypothetical protein IHE44_0007364 [Lamprotornis superbus]
MGKKAASSHHLMCCDGQPVCAAGAWFTPYLTKEHPKLSLNFQIPSEHSSIHHSAPVQHNSSSLKINILGLQEQVLLSLSSSVHFHLGYPPRRAGGRNFFGIMSLPHLTCSEMRAQEQRVGRARVGISGILYKDICSLCHEHSDLHWLFMLHLSDINPAEYLVKQLQPVSFKETRDNPKMPPFPILALSGATVTWRLQRKLKSDICGTSGVCPVLPASPGRRTGFRRKNHSFPGKDLCVEGLCLGKIQIYGECEQALDCLCVERAAASCRDTGMLPPGCCLSFQLGFRGSLRSDSFLIFMLREPVLEFPCMNFWVCLLWVPAVIAEPWSGAQGELAVVQVLCHGLSGAAALNSPGSELFSPTPRGSREGGNVLWRAAAFPRYSLSSPKAGSSVAGAGMGSGTQIPPWQGCPEQLWLPLDPWECPGLDRAWSDLGQGQVTPGHKCLAGGDSQGLGQGKLWGLWLRVLDTLSCAQGAALAPGLGQGCQDCWGQHRDRLGVMGTQVPDDSALGESLEQLHLGEVCGGMPSQMCHPQLPVQELWGLSCGFWQAYLWDSNKDLAEWLEKQLTEEEGVRSVVEENIKYISRDYVLKQIRGLVQANPEVAMDSIVHMTQHISPTQRAEVVRILSTMDSPSSTLARGSVSFGQGHEENV